MELIWGLGVFALVSSITPGPNNLMLMSSGATYGLFRTLPHMLGVSIGFMVMVILVGLGIVKLFDLYPVSYSVLKWFCVVYLCYLAFKIAISKPSASQGEPASDPFTFLQAAGFQWVNPKAWTMALTSISIYAPQNDLVSVVLVAVIFGLVNFPAISVWATAGSQMQDILHKGKRLTVFNYTMAVILLCSLYPVLLP